MRSWCVSSVFFRGKHAAPIPEMDNRVVLRLLSSSCCQLLVLPEREGAHQRKHLSKVALLDTAGRQTIFRTSCRPFREWSCG
uniref:Putative secreted protein n=1 Tax=Anopheles darlingi TaxID=43151 RepID=A0A2M4D3F1_ANODA